MKIIEFSEFGNPADVLHLKSVPDAAPATGEVKVKVLATPIHPANLLQISGQCAAAPKLPAIPSGEGVGEVVALGEGVTNLKIGQRVLLAGAGGTWRDELIAPAAALIPAPPGDVEQLAMLAVNPLTAHHMLTKFVDLKEGDWVIQSAANSAVGEMVIQLAALRGIRTINVVRRVELRPGLLELGGTAVVIDGPDLAEQVAKVTDGADIKLGIDAVGGRTFERLVETLGYGGTLVSYGSLSGDQPILNLRGLIANDIHLRGFWLAKWFKTASFEEQMAAFGELAPLIASGQVKTKVDSRFPLEEIAEAVTRAAEGGRDGKVLLTPNAA